MKTKLIVLAFLAASALLAQPRVYVGARIGYPAPAVMYAAPPAPLVSYMTPAPGDASISLLWLHRAEV